MRLISLKMQNFRQHVDTYIEFPEGVTAIVGSNGSGKTTILEGISWALYGASAVRGNNDSIRASSAVGGSKVCVELLFELSGVIYKIIRTLGGSAGAVMEIDGRTLRTGVGEVTEAITKLLGMDYRAFFTSFFTGQKQLEFMSHLEGRARAGAISKMLGYEKVTKARDVANEDRKGLDREIDGLEKGLPDVEDLKNRKKLAESILSDSKKNLEKILNEHKSLSVQIDDLKPKKEDSDKKFKLYTDLHRRLETDKADVKRMSENLKHLEIEINELENKRKELESLKPQLEEYEKAKIEYRKHAELQKYESKRNSVLGSIASIETDTKKLIARQKIVFVSIEKSKIITIALKEAENQLNLIEEKLRKLREEKIAKENSIKAEIKHLTLQMEESRAKRELIVIEGVEGKCPTCERPLLDEMDLVITGFDNKIASITKHISSLEAENNALISNTSMYDQLVFSQMQIKSQIEQIIEEKKEADMRVFEYESITKDIKTRDEELINFKKEIEKLPSGFDQEMFTQLRKTGEKLNPIHTKSVELITAIKREPELNERMNNLTRELSLADTRVNETENILHSLEFSSDDYEKLKQQYDNISQKFTLVSLEKVKKLGEVKTAEAVLEQVLNEEKFYKSRIKTLKEKRIERLRLHTLAQALDNLKNELNARIRPELESIASELLSITTDGRYNVMEIDDQYKAMIRDDGELKPVISGGEDDIVNLSLRLAISQMIADRAGQSFSLMILDEVFGSLDDARRNNVISLLQNLKNRFEQIILITHIESIHDIVDNCLWVEFDEKNKTSRLIDRSYTTEQTEVGVLM